MLGGDTLQEWIAVLELVVFIGGGGIFVGMTRSSISSLKDEVAVVLQGLDKLGTRTDRFEAFSAQSTSDRAQLAARLQAAERAVADSAAASRDLLSLVTAFRAATEVEQRYMREKLDRNDRNISGLQRQMATVAKGKLADLSELVEANA